MACLGSGNEQLNVPAGHEECPQLCGGSYGQFSLLFLSIRKAWLLMELSVFLETQKMLRRPIFALVNSRPLLSVFWGCWWMFCGVLFRMCEGLQHFLSMELLIPADSAVAHVGF